MQDTDGRAAPIPPTESGAVRLSWKEPAGILALSIVNFLLRIMTLGVYHFWGKTEVRHRIWSSARLNGEPLAYTGTGRELLMGFVLVFAVVVLPTAVLSFVAALILGPSGIGVIQLMVMLVFYYLTGVAIHRAQRYRLTRTEWRGIRGGMSGNAWRFGWTYLWTAFLIPLSLGWIIPWRATKLQSRLTNDMRFGNRPFQFAAVSGPLYPRFVFLWIGSFFTLALIGATIFTAVLPLGLNPATLEQGVPPSPNKLMLLGAMVYGLMFVGFLIYAMLSAWYRAGVMNHFAAHTSFEGARFQGSATAPSMIRLAVGNFFILVIGAAVAGALTSTVLGIGVLGVVAATGGWSDGALGLPQWVLQAIPTLTLIVVVAGFGALVPVTQTRSARYFVQRLSLNGTIPLAAIGQAAKDDIKRGEGLAQAFDVDAF